MSLWLIVIESIQALCRKCNIKLQQQSTPECWLAQRAASELQDGSQGLWDGRFGVPRQRSLQQPRFHQHSLNMASFHAWRLILISGICHARARLMNCNVIDVIHWWARRVWRMSPVEPAGASAITAHPLGVHTLTSAGWTSQPRDADGEVILDSNGTVIGSRPSSECATQLITRGIESLFRT